MNRAIPIDDGTADEPRATDGSPVFIRFVSNARTIDHAFIDKRAQPPRRGVVLVMVLIVVALLAISAYAFSSLMLTERKAALLGVDRAQSRLAVDSGVAAVRQMLMLDEQTLLDEGGLVDNPGRLQGVALVNDEEAARQARFAVLAPELNDQGEPTGIRFGLEDESARLNMSMLLLAEDQQIDGGHVLLMALPGMTDEVADAILDWVDEDDDPRMLGAEIDYYSGLNPPYAPRNGPIGSVEELLLVRGMTPGLLFGLDLNRNGTIDPHEGDQPIGDGAITAEGGWELGLAAYLTLHGAERNVDSAGNTRIWLNTEDMQQLHADLSAALPAEWANFIVAYRQYGAYTGSDSGEPAGSQTLDLSKPGKTQISQVLDLIGKKVRFKPDAVGDGEEPEPVVFTSPFPEEPIAMGFYLPRLMDAVTVNPAPTIPGRININRASRTVLSGIPGIDEEMVEAIIGARGDDPESAGPARQHEAWLLTEAIVTLDEMKALMPFVCAGGDVYRAQIVGFFDDSGVASRAEIVIDATTELPRLVSWKDMSHLGRGYPLSTLGTALIE